MAIPHGRLIVMSLLMVAINFHKTAGLDDLTMRESHRLEPMNSQ
jgi:hypothetical protein